MVKIYTLLKKKRFMKIYNLLGLSLLIINIFASDIQDNDLLKGSENTPDFEILTLLHNAYKEGDRDQLFDLLKQIPNLELKDKDGYSPLHFACIKGDLEIVKFLIEECKVNTESQTNTGVTCLHLACRNDHFEIVKYLIYKNPNLLSLRETCNLPHRNRVYYIYPMGDLKNINDVKTLIFFVIKKTDFKLTYKYLGKWIKNKEIGLILLQHGIDHCSFYLHDVIESFFPFFYKDIVNEYDSFSLKRFNLIKNELKDMITLNKWGKIREIKGKLFSDQTKISLMRNDAARIDTDGTMIDHDGITMDNRSDCPYMDYKPSYDIYILLPTFFHPSQIFEMIKELNQIDKYHGYKNLREFVKIVSIEFDLNKLQDEDNNNLLHIISDIDTYKFIILRINPSLITKKNKEQRLPFLQSFFEYFYLNYIP